MLWTAPECIAFPKQPQAPGGEELSFSSRQETCQAQCPFYMNETLSPD